LSQGFTADESDKKTIVTINETIEVPGKVLPAGTYVFKMLDSSDRTLVAIYNADEMHLITTVQGIPTSRMETPDRPSFSSKSGPPANQKP